MSKRKKKSRTELHPRVMISGYYGFDNLGDELILKVLTDELKSRDVNITVLSANPQKTAQTYGVDAIHRNSLIDIIDALTRSNLFISGGGGLFQDATGPMSPVYYGGLIFMASFFSVPVCFWSQGVGPLRGAWPRRVTASALRKCEAVTVRDEKSAALVETLCCKKPEITADPVWLLKTPKRPKKQTSDIHRIGISLRPWPELTHTRMEALARSLKAHAKGLLQPVEFVLLPFQEHEDIKVLQELSALLQKYEAGKTVLVKPEAVMEQIGSCHMLLGMRFHSLILALLQQVPVYGLVYDPKVASLLEMLDLKGMEIKRLETLEADALRQAMAKYPNVNLKPYKKQAQRNFDLLNRLLEIPEAELVL